ncbi:hypothetical protein CFBP6600_39150 [Xanthomonas arboricola pv. corylina]|nr:hypothetical protein CFBP6600_39150 [Xanthomonas arboricola pv. corylina]CAE6844714.1 hypothetical protein CFBP6600_39150 [Xanthomonas arboricola pv. corylina]
MTVGKRLKEERKRLRLTQQEMADACGISKWAQLYFEKDQNMPGGAYLLAAHARGVDIVYVLLEHRMELDPSEAALVAAFRAAPQDMRAAMLDNLGLARNVSERAAPVVTFNDNSRVGHMVTTTAAINQSNMQINMGGRKKRSRDRTADRTAGPRKRVRYRQLPGDVEALNCKGVRNGNQFAQRAYACRSERLRSRTAQRC